MHYVYWLFSILSRCGVGAGVCCSSLLGLYRWRCSDQCVLWDCSCIVSCTGGQRATSMLSSSRGSSWARPTGLQFHCAALSSSWMGKYVACFCTLSFQVSDKICCFSFCASHQCWNCVDLFVAGEEHCCDCWYSHRWQEDPTDPSNEGYRSEVHWDSKGQDCQRWWGVPHFWPACSPCSTWAEHGMLNFNSCKASVAYS
jgi:hypothetical protein